MPATRRTTARRPARKTGPARSTKARAPKAPPTLEGLPEEVMPKGKKGKA